MQRGGVEDEALPGAKRRRAHVSQRVEDDAAAAIVVTDLGHHVTRLRVVHVPRRVAL